MNKGIRFTDEFKRDAVAQVVERGYAVSEVAVRLGISTKSLYTWKAQFAKSPRVRSEVADQAAEIRRLKRELARATNVFWSIRRKVSVCQNLRGCFEGDAIRKNDPDDN